MSSAYESADLLLKLYDLRREATLRQARSWFATFNPQSVDEVTSVLRGEHGVYFRMVTSFWDMAAALVTNGAINEQMFNDANGEQIYVFAKLEPFLAAYRAETGQTHFLRHLETLVVRMPDAAQRLRSVRERLRGTSTRTASPSSHS